MEKVVSVRLLRCRVADYVARVQAGEQFVILRHGRPIALLRSRVNGERVVRLPVDTFPSLPISAALSRSRTGDLSS